MITVTELGTPFDSVDSPTTVATPSCCCCCCCCIASITSATVLAGRLVRKDALESQAAAESMGLDHSGKGGLIALACLVPVGVFIVLILFGQAVDSYFGFVDNSEWFALAAAIIVGAAVLGGLRLGAGAPPLKAFRSSAVMMLIFPALVVAEIVVVLFSVGIFWLTTPLWIAWAVRATQFEPDEAAAERTAIPYVPPRASPADVAPLPPPPTFPPMDEAP